MTLERRKPQYVVTPVVTHTGGVFPTPGGEVVTLQVPVAHQNGCDEPINSRNSPRSLNILTSKYEKEKDFSKG